MMASMIVAHKSSVIGGLPRRVLAPGASAGRDGGYRVTLRRDRDGVLGRLFASFSVGLALCGGRSRGDWRGAAGGC
jgi:hypothetical protein